MSSDSNQPGVLHIIHTGKFAAPLIEFLQANDLQFEKQFFFFFGDKEQEPLRQYANSDFASDLGSPTRVNAALLRHIRRAKKVVLHGLWPASLVRLLAVRPWILSKCYWVMWGGDLYRYESRGQNLLTRFNEIFRRFVIRRIGHLVTYVDGDVALARQWYGARGEYHECLVYPSNLYKDYDVRPTEDSTTRIQIGNSADASNEHLDILERLLQYKDADIKIYAPLSYGDKSYAKTVVRAGNTMFGDKFVPMTEFLDPSDYVEFLGGIDIAIFNHRRQQAMGNIVTLLGLGKKVCLRRNVTTWDMLTEQGIKVFAVDENLLDDMDADSKQRNAEIVKDRYSEQRLRRQLSELLYG